jgi:DNA-binding LacI/PurR family transcriptional regulator
VAVTIRDVAKHAEVSIATVSRALSAPELVAERTRTRVIAAAAALGYEPNRAARSLITGRTGFVGAVVPDLTNPFFLGVLKGIQAAARDAGHHVLLADTAENPATEADLIGSIARQVDGLLLLSSRIPTARLQQISSGSSGSCRAVLFNRLVPGFPAVLVDSGDGMRQLVQYLGALGHRRCAYAGGPTESWADADRRRGLAKACGASGVRIVDLGAFAPVYGAGARAADLALEAGVTAVIAFNDLMALGIVARLRDRGVHVPLEVSVAGFDDIAMASMSSPRLTTVAAPLELAGRSAVALLMSMLSERGGGPTTAANGNGNGHTRGRMLPVRLVARASTGAPRRGR